MLRFDEGLTVYRHHAPSRTGSRRAANRAWALRDSPGSMAMRSDTQNCRRCSSNRGRATSRRCSALRATYG